MKYSHPALVMVSFYKAYYLLSIKIIVVLFRLRSCRIVTKKPDEMNLSALATDFLQISLTSIFSPEIGYLNGRHRYIISI
jgi:hypothetical protein